jgi:hypothetical protein
MAGFNFNTFIHFKHICEKILQICVKLGKLCLVGLAPDFYRDSNCLLRNRLGGAKWLFGWSRRLSWTREFLEKPYFGILVVELSPKLQKRIKSLYREIESRILGYFATLPISSWNWSFKFVSFFRQVETVPASRVSISCQFWSWQNRTPCRACTSVPQWQKKHFCMHFRATMAQLSSNWTPVL